MKTTSTTTKIVMVSTSLIILGGLGLALAYKRRQNRVRKAKNLSIQIV